MFRSNEDVGQQAAITKCLLISGTDAMGSEEKGKAKEKGGQK